MAYCPIPTAGHVYKCWANFPFHTSLPTQPLWVPGGLKNLNCNDWLYIAAAKCAKAKSSPEEMRP